MALSNITALTNAEMWDAARALSPTFASHTSQGTAQRFDEKGFDALTRSDVDAINEYFEISLRIGFQALTVSQAKNILEGSGLVEAYHTMNGGYLQRMSVNSIKPITPGYRNLQDGDVRSPFITRKPEVGERFFQRNFDYQSLVTVQQFQVKQIFVSEYGMSSFVAGIMTGLENGYVIQRYENTMELISAMLNSTKFPLQSTQVYSVGGFDMGEATNAQVVSFLKIMKNIKTNIETKVQSSAFNAAKFETRWNPEDSVVLVRAGVKTELESINALNAPGFGTSIPFDNVIEVDNFGGLIPYAPAPGANEVELPLPSGYTETKLSDLVGQTLTIDASSVVAGASVSIQFIAGTNPNTVDAVMTVSDISLRVTGYNVPAGIGKANSWVPVFNIDGIVFKSGQKAETRSFKGIKVLLGKRVYPVYDEFGSVMKDKYSLTKNGAVNNDVDVSKLAYVDPNANVLAVVCQKGLLFEDIQNEYSVQPIYNPRTLCTNYWANQPETGLAYDPYYGCIVIEK